MTDQVTVNEFVKAALENNVEKVAQCIIQGVGINAVDSKGRSALVTASSNPNPTNVAKFLLKQGADVNFAITSIDAGLYKKEPGDEAFVLSTTALHYAASNGNLELMKLLIDKKADVNAATWDWHQTPLDYASRNGHVQAMKLLIDKGAKIDEQALGLATRTGKLEAMKLLLDKGAKIDAIDGNGYTPLHIATSDNELEAMKLLLDRGAKIDAADYTGSTPLHIAARNKDRVQVMKLLIDKGAKANAADQDGWTPMHFAANYGNVDAIVTLIKSGGRLGDKDKDGATPIDELKKYFADKHDKDGLEKAMEKIKATVKKAIETSQTDDVRRVGFENLLALGEKPSGATAVVYNQAALPPVQSTPPIPTGPESPGFKV